ncbi:MAG TPA: DNA-3-methyladenine glycosylase I [Acetobacteraceae bacterium]
MGGTPGVVRCGWANGSAAMTEYHDREWGKPLHGDSALFEFLVLEGAQAGLSWRSVLERRDGYRAAFHGYDLARVAAMSDTELEGLLADAAIIRNRLKVFSVRANARAALAVATEHGSLDDYLWSFVEHRPIVNSWTEAAQVPARTDLSDTLSRALKKRGFSFVGSTICYAFMQATGMIDDHLTRCACRAGAA